MPLNSARRGFLFKTIAVLPVAALGASACSPPTRTAAQETSAASGSGPSADKSPDKPYQPAYFHPDEWLFIQAAVARLIPADELGVGALEAGVPQFIDRQMDAVFGYAANWYMQGPFVPSAPEFGYQAALAPREVYRAGIAAFDGYCKSAFGGKTFAELDAAGQDAALKSLESGAVEFETVSGKTFFSFLLQNTKEGYLSDPIHGGNKNAAAWAMIGFPGARADYADWVGRPGEKYPLPPVSINGPQG